MKYHYFDIFQLSNLIFFLLLLLERGGGREKEMERTIDVRDKHHLVVLCMRRNWAPNPQPRHVP